MQRGAQFDAAANDLILFELDDRSDDVDLSFGARTFADDVLEGGVILGPAVGVAGAVFGDSADEYLVSACGFGPAYGDAEEVGVAERNVGDGDFAHVCRCRGGVELIFGDGDGLVGKRGAADGTEVIEMDDEAAIGGDGVGIGVFGKGAAFSGLGALAVAGMEEGDFFAAVAGDGFG